MSDVIDSAVAIGTEIDRSIREGLFQSWLSTSVCFPFARHSKHV